MSIKEEWEARLSNFFPEETVMEALQEAEKQSTEAMVAFADAVEEVARSLAAGLDAVTEFYGTYSGRTMSDLEEQERIERAISNKKNLKRMITGKRKPREWD